MKTHTILIFDCEEAVRESLRLILTEEGFHCFTAENESEALRILSSHAIDIAIFDIQVVGAAYLLKKLKKIHPHIKIILISSYSEFEVTQQALAAGADNYALKPLDFDELILLIKNTLPVPNK